MSGSPLSASSGRPLSAASFCWVASTIRPPVPASTLGEICWLPRPSTNPWPPITDSTTTAPSANPASSASVTSAATRTPSWTTSTPSRVVASPSSLPTASVVAPGPRMYLMSGFMRATTSLAMPSTVAGAVPEEPAFLPDNAVRAAGTRSVP